VLLDHRLVLLDYLYSRPFIETPNPKDDKRADSYVPLGIRRSAWRGLSLVSFSRGVATTAQIKESLVLGIPNTMFLTGGNGSLQVPIT